MIVIETKSVLDNIIYTQSHFTFEESLQEEANYKYRVSIAQACA